MAIWDLVCYKCGNRMKDVFLDANDVIPKCECGEDFCKDYSSLRISVVGDLQPHYNISLGKWVKSRRHLRQLLWETNSRTDDITPTGGLTPEERAEREGRQHVAKTVLERRKEPFWGMNPPSPEDGLYAD